MIDFNSPEGLGLKGAQHCSAGKELEHIYFGYREDQEVHWGPGLQLTWRKLTHQRAVVAHWELWCGLTGYPQSSRTLVPVSI